MRGDYYDIWATAKTIDILEEARSLMDIKAVLLLNQVNRNTTIAKDALEALQEFKLPILDTEICQRIAFKRAITEGKGVSEYEPAGKAAAEIKNLWKGVKEKWL
jgi:chromosome partitioning protein